MCCDPNTSKLFDRTRMHQVWKNVSTREEMNKNNIYQWVVVERLRTKQENRRKKKNIVFIAFGSIQAFQFYVRLRSTNNYNYFYFIFILRIQFRSQWDFLPQWIRLFTHWTNHFWCCFPLTHCLCLSFILVLSFQAIRMKYLYNIRKTHWKNNVVGYFFSCYSLSLSHSNNIDRSTHTHTQTATNAFWLLVIDTGNWAECSSGRRSVTVDIRG